MRGIKKINAVFLSLGLALAPFIASAGALDTSSKNLTAVNDTTGRAGSTLALPTLVGGFISVLLGSMGVIFIVFIIQAGILYMTAAGDATKVDKAKKLITQAIIGLIIVSSAYAISAFVISQISGGISP